MAVDTVISYVVGFEPGEISAVRIAATEGLGVGDLVSIVIIQQTCLGCYAYLLGSLDSFKGTGIDVEKKVAEKDECVFIADGVPALDPLNDSHKSIVSFVPILTEKAERNINGKVAM